MIIKTSLDFDLLLKILSFKDQYQAANLRMGAEIIDALGALDLEIDSTKVLLPPHKSHDPQYNQKRSDPFQFGSRYLGQDDNVFEFNAWDHVETDDAYKEYSEAQYAKQREAPVSAFDQSKLNIYFSWQI